MNIEQLAADFSMILNEWLTPEQMDEVNKRNANEPNNSVCHTHDFCDANQAMLDAAEIQDKVFDLTKESGEFDAAWNLARSCEFNPFNIGNIDRR